MAGSYSPYQGNCPRSVNKDAKYVIRSNKGKAVVAVTYVASNQERWLATTEEHPELVRIVNDIKVGVGGTPNGPFYINEYGQVVVPVGHDAIYYLADEEYDMPLRFEFEGNVISGEGVDLQGNPLEPGDLWSGPHPGIPYILEAGAGDIRYDSTPRPNVTRHEKLSSHIGQHQAGLMAKLISAVKGWAGGRFYVNEWRQMFAPVDGEDGLKYWYIGHLDAEEPWFPKSS